MSETDGAQRWDLPAVEGAPLPRPGAKGVNVMHLTLVEREAWDHGFRDGHAEGVRKGVRQGSVRRQSTPGGNLVRVSCKVAECPRVADPLAMPWTCRALVAGTFRGEGDRGTRAVDLTFNWDPNAQRLSLTSTDGGIGVYTSRQDGLFEFWGLTAGQTYTLAVHSPRFTFQPQSVSVIENVTTINMIAEQ